MPDDDVREWPSRSSDNPQDPGEAEAVGGSATTVEWSRILAAQTMSERLRLVRHDLLDLGLRNPLLSYRLLKARGVELDVSDPQVVYDRLVRDGQKLSFLATQIASDDTQRTGASLDRCVASHTGDRNGAFPTIHPAEDLDNRLLKTYYAARTFVEEQGIGVLYLAFGFLTWYESASSDAVRLAPLVLVPVHIHRTDVRSRFHIQYTEEDLEANLSLQAKLNQDFGIPIPDLPDDAFLLQEYFDQVTSVISGQARWSISEAAVALGFFSFGTLLMYKDLLEENWVGVMDIASHPIAKALLGDGFGLPSPAIPRDAFLDDYVEPGDTRHVLDADSSQMAVLVEVKQGHNLIVQGPPGTGKSQTIANIIAEAISEGKHVLFVAEKMAALEVVKRRLDQVGLGDACLELHSEKSNKRAVLAELKRTLELDPSRSSDESMLPVLTEYRDNLNAYCQELNSPILESGVTPYRCFGELLRLERILEANDTPETRSDSMLVWTEGDFREHRALVEQLQVVVRQIGRPVDHPYWACRPPSLTTTTGDTIRRICAQAYISCLQLQKMSQMLSDHLHMPVPEDVHQTRELLDTGHRLLSAPSLASINVESELWRTHADGIDRAIRIANHLYETRSRHASTVKPAAWAHNMSTIRSVYQVHATDRWRLTSRDYRSAKRELAALLPGRLPHAFEQQVAIIKTITDVQDLSSRLDRVSSRMLELFGEWWESRDSHWPYLHEVADWLQRLHQDVADGSLVPLAIRYVADNLDIGVLKEILDQVQNALAQYEETAAAVPGAVGLDETLLFGEGSSFARQSYANVLRLLDGWADAVARRGEIARYNQIAEGLCGLGLQDYAKLVASWHDSGRFIVNVFDRTWYRTLLDAAIDSRQAVAMFEGGVQGHRLTKFRELDRWQVENNRTYVTALHRQRIPRPSSIGQMGELRHEFEKQKRHLPIRRLIERTGHVIQAIKPVLMMSPISIAKYLPPGSIEFDLIVFDEASQIRPADALGAILRGNQIVVTGDSRQLPPTSFFRSIVEPDDPEESPTADLESILGLFRVQGVQEQTLRWHYRSRHPSLIAVSNYEFYGNRLLVFPSPDDSRENIGLSFHHLPHAFYDRGKSRTNQIEAQRIAEAVLEHARRHPDWTLGVVAFSASQMQAVQDQLERLLKENPDCESFFGHHEFEPFFIKNLENVQGDERDVIYISVGYGRSSDGKLLMSFGPLNSDGGERRLNVIITRARIRCEVFSNISADDIDLSRAHSPGVSALKRFLRYAETRQIEMPTSTDRLADSAFEEEVAAELQNCGYQIEHQIGSAGYSIDLAVKDAQQPGRYVIGIECDGATYHNARSARDRDRLRQEVLEGLGWRIYRVWSTDWFYHRMREIERLVTAVEAAKAGTYHDLVDLLPKETSASVEPSSEQTSPAELLPRQVGATQAELQPSDMYTTYEDRIYNFSPLHQVSPRIVADWVKKVVDAESPIHIDELTRRITKATGTGRAGSRIQQAIRAGVARSADDGVVILRGDFVWSVGMQQPPLRNRSNLPVTARKIELIAPEEIAEAIRSVVQSALGISEEDVPSAACMRLGFGRAGGLIAEGVESIMKRMLANGDLVVRNGYVVLGESDRIEGGCVTYT